MSLKQVINSVYTTIGYGHTTNYVAVLGGKNIAAFNDPTENAAKVMLPRAGTFSKLYVQAIAGSNGLTPPAFTLMLRKNGSDTALTVSVPAGGALTINSSDSVSFSQFNDVNYKIDTTLQSAFGFYVLVSIEFEPTTGNNVSVYGLSVPGGSFADGAGIIGGAFNNGYPQTYTAGIPTQSNTYSLGALNGNITSLNAKAYLDPNAGTWTGFIIKDGVIQDGSGGTVDTVVTIDTATPNWRDSSSFNLPIIPGHRYDIAYLINGDSVGFDLSSGLNCSITVEGDNDFEYMFCGGNNNTISNIGTFYLWLGSEQLAVGESVAETPVGSAGLRALGFYGELNIPPAPGRNFTFTVRKSGSDTALTFIIVDNATTGSDTGDVSFLANDFIDLSYLAFNTPNASAFHWGLLLSSNTVSPSFTGGIYQLVPGKTNDTIYTVGGGTSVVKIPDPFADTAEVEGE